VIASLHLEVSTNLKVFHFVNDGLSLKLDGLQSLSVVFHADEASDPEEDDSTGFVRLQLGLAIKLKHAVDTVNTPLVVCAHVRAHCEEDPVVG